MFNEGDVVTFRRYWASFGQTIAKEGYHEQVKGPQRGLIDSLVMYCIGTITKNLIGGEDLLRFVQRREGIGKV